MLCRRKVVFGFINSQNLWQKQLLKSKCDSLASARLQSTALYSYETLEDDGGGGATTVSLPKEARVVICGGGVMGAAVAYHLAELGWGPQTVLLDKGRCGAGTTWHLSGLVGVFKPSLTQVKLAQSSVQLYKEMEAKGLKTGWKQCGSLCIARTRDRMTVFRRMKAQAISWNIECDLVTPEEAGKLCPLIATDDLQGGLWIPGDGVGDPYKICLSLISAAKEGGVQVIENCAVQQIVNQNGKVTAVGTSKGMVECQYFVNCGGFWARKIGKMSEPYVKVPLHACEHYYLHTKPIPGLDPMTPVVRDQDGHIYFRENDGRLLAGGFEPVAKPAFEDGTIPESSAERILPEDWDHFHVLLEQMLLRVPNLGDAILERLCNGPEAFSPDCKWIVGEAPEIQNYYVATGMKTIGISAAGGVGRATAELIVNGSSQYDMYELDISRFLGLHNNRKFLRDRVREVPGNEYDRSNGLHPYRIAYTNTFGKPPWYDWSKGTEVVESLQYLCSNDVDIPIGGIIHTGMQNKNGGYENDCSLARLAENQYFALHVYTQLIENGKKYGIQHAGYYAMRALRVERFFAFWGQDLDTTTTPLECGRFWRVKFDKDMDFIGRDALMKQRDEGVKRMYVQLILQDHDHEIDLWPWGGEPIYRDGKYVGATTTTGYGFTFKKQVCLGFVQNFDEQGKAQVVTPEYVTSGEYEVDVAGMRFTAKVNLRSPNLPTKYPDKERLAYRATRDGTDDIVISSRSKF
ncbi:hypothetical protein C0J52_12258 [Blattella germanica]|nr:hypothetical protein C0J52_12258 [Blattella germanica]